MATFQKRGDSWRAIIRRVGTPTQTKTFRNKALAEAWARGVENKIDHGHTPVAAHSKETVDSVLERFATEVSPTRRGARWELLRIAVFRRAAWSAKRINAITAADLQEWRDERLKEVSGSTVNRDLNLLGSIFTYAAKEWQLPIQTNPVQKIRRPKNNPHRRRTFTPDEVTALTKALGYEEGKCPKDAAAWAGLAFLLALETAMRSGELCSIERRFVSEKSIHLPGTKNGDSRDVPLSKRARVLVGEMLKWGGRHRLLPIADGTMGVRFRQARNALGFDDLHFHDARHTATTNLAKKLHNVLELGAVTGHKDLRYLKIYFNPEADEMADRLG